MSKEKVDIGKIIYDETESRLRQMSEPGYEFPPKAGKGTYLAIALIIAVCIILIILCLTGVIS